MLREITMSEKIKYYKIIRLGEEDVRWNKT